MSAHYEYTTRHRSVADEQPVQLETSSKNSPSRTSVATSSNWKKTYKMNPDMRINELGVDVVHQLSKMLNTNQDAFDALLSKTPLKDMDEEAAMRQSAEKTRLFLNKFGSGGWTVRRLAEVFLRIPNMRAASLFFVTRSVRFPQCEANSRLLHQVSAEEPININYVATGFPPPRFKWYRLTNSWKLIKESDNGHLQLATCARRKHHQGTFRVEISNQAESVRALTFRVDVLHDDSEDYQEVVSHLASPPPLCREREREPSRVDVHVNFHMPSPIPTPIPASAPAPGALARSGVVRKVAFLLGEGQFSGSLSPLCAPECDLDRLQVSLEKIGFQVVKLMNLGLNDLKRAILTLRDMLHKNVYAVVYLAGHGFYVDKWKDSYLCPSDVSTACRPQDCLTMHWVKYHLLKASPGLLMLFYDFCLLYIDVGDQKNPYSDYQLEPHGNLVEIYATQQGCSAEEVVRERTSVMAHYLHREIEDQLKQTGQCDVPNFAANILRRTHNGSKQLRDKQAKEGAQDLQMPQNPQMIVPAVVVDKSLFVKVDPRRGQGLGHTEAHNRVDAQFNALVESRSRDTAFYEYSDCGRVRLGLTYPKDNILRINVEAAHGHQGQFQIEVSKEDLQRSLKYMCDISMSGRVILIQRLERLALECQHGVSALPSFPVRVHLLYPELDVVEVAVKTPKIVFLFAQRFTTDAQLVQMDSHLQFDKDFEETLSKTWVKLRHN